MEEGYTYRVVLDLTRYQNEPFPEDLKPDILIDSVSFQMIIKYEVFAWNFLLHVQRFTLFSVFQLLVVPVHSGMEMFQGTFDGQRRSQQFGEYQCLEEEMIVPNRRPNEECAGLMFSMSAIIHDGARRKTFWFIYLETYHG